MVLNSTSTGAICFRTSNKSSKPSTKITTTSCWKPANSAPAMFRDDCVTAFDRSGARTQLAGGADVAMGAAEAALITPLCLAVVPSQARAVW